VSAALPHRAFDVTDAGTSSPTSKLDLEPVGRALTWPRCAADLRCGREEVVMQTPTAQMPQAVERAIADWPQGAPGLGPKAPRLLRRTR
jgi:hypothetical protein